MRARALLAGVAALCACGGSPPKPLVVPPVPSRITTLARAEVSAIPSVPPPADVAPMLAEIAPARVRAIVDKLVAFGTRHTLSDTTSETRGIGAARRWLKSELERYAAESGRSGDLAMKVRLDAHTVAPDGKRIPREVEVDDVVAVLPGAMSEASRRRYYVVGHYDSRASDPLDATSDAPGANDDASGVAVALELARVMSKRRYDATLVFVATAGEEQGLFGAKLLAKEAHDLGEDVRAVLNDDIVGDPSTASGGAGQRGKVRLFSEGVPSPVSPEQLAEIRRLSAESDSPSRELARFIGDVAHWQGLPVEPMLVFRPDRFLRGGDHLAFNELGIPAVRFTTVDETYARQHQNVRVEGGVHYGDTPEHVDADYLAGVARANGAALAHLANGPSTPPDIRVLVADLGYGADLRWSPSPEPDVAGYEVVWRETTSPVWQHARDVGPATKATLPDVSKDDCFLGVRAYDKAGYRSPVGFARAAKE